MKINNNPKVTVVVPVYNEERYVKRCLDSLLNQKVIVIDDGSTDGSGAICDKYKNHFKVIHTENNGVSHARNLGIELADTEYVSFLDSDDELPPNAVEIMEKNIRQYPENIIQFNHYRAFNGNIRRKYYQKAGYCTPDKPPISWAGVWNKVYKKSFLDDNGIRFYEGCFYGEDEAFNFLCLVVNGGVRCVEDYALTRHFDNPNRATRTACLKSFENAKEHLLKLKQDLADRGMNKEIYGDYLEYIIGHCDRGLNRMKLKEEREKK